MRLRCSDWFMDVGASSFINSDLVNLWNEKKVLAIESDFDSARAGAGNYNIASILLLCHVSPREKRRS